MTNDANERQNRAANPRASTWLSANAGSGKTRVLTNRVARLLLHGTEPQNIVCLTYTKAAASEMQNRLFQTLGRWAMLGDEALQDELRELGEAPPDSLSRARTLFARAVETPGGLRIQTIHSFCSAILRQFPLEAGVSPQFRELDEKGQKELVAEVMDALAEARVPAVLAMSRLHSDDDVGSLALTVAGRASGFLPIRTRDEVFAAFGVPPGRTMDDILATVLEAGDLAFLKGLSALIPEDAGTRDTELKAFLGELPDVATSSVLQKLEGHFLNKSGDNAFKAKLGKIPTGPLYKGPFQPFVRRLETIMQRVEDARPARVALEAAERTVALHAFAAAFLPAYAATKLDRGVLDFDDLIHKTRALLAGPSLEWVRYKLDNRIEHILVDEAQDTSPVQWDVIGTLADEIATGRAARGGGDRTVFVVGDKKQSIYSFQGADARAFEAVETKFATILGAGRNDFSQGLQYSFRSSQAVLTAVDEVMRPFETKGIGRIQEHLAFQGRLEGRVDLWPLIEPSETPAKVEWYDPVDRPSPDAPAVVLANRLACRVGEMLKTGTVPGENGDFRRIVPGDILILVQRRREIFDQIIRAFKSANLPIAGSDQLKVGAELAVRDLLALLSFLSLPEDDLSLAAALRSPLFGWSERRLYSLAQGRGKAPLWARFRERQGDHADDFARIEALLKLADFARPYELLEHVLTVFEVRKRLVRRLGPEAEDGIDELLNQALAYERSGVPSLTGFLALVHADEQKIKRQSETGNLIRVMTVHGAKGLESEIVILPDTTRAEPRKSASVVLSANGVPLWPGSKADNPPLVTAALEAQKEAELEERNRLLYVAMTRARTWLIVCGVETKGDDAIHWHRHVKEGMERLGAERLETPTGEGLRMQQGDWPDALEGARSGVVAAAAAPKPLPVGPGPEPQGRPKPLSPSDLGGAKVAGGGALEEEAALRRGRQVHLLLEHLPLAADPEGVATRLLSFGPDAEPDAGRAELVAEARRVIAAHPALFGADALAEVDIAAELAPLGAPVLGTIDRLVVGPDRVLAVDFKTNAVVPDRPEDTPEGILRQMGAYLEALEQVYPKRRVDVAVLWTGNAQLMALPHAILRAALGRATTS